MNRNKLKSYAPEARRDFIQAVTDRAALYGLTAKTIEPMTEEGDVAIVAGRAFPKAVSAKRKKLAERIGKLGFEQTIEAMAYTWFNRLVAIRYMELHGYLEHGYRVLSHGEGHAQPEIVEHAEHVDLPGLDREKVIELKLDGTKEEELYRMLLIAQCNALHRAMPFLFESIDDETELLLPDHLLHSDSLIRKLVQEIPEEDWQEVEIIGWLYQFYIIEEKKRIDGYTKNKAVLDADIAAKTQLFTPDWIVKYLVQNSLGRQWMATYPKSPLKARMEYYIDPAEQTPEVQAKLAEITPRSLNPEELTLLDPACGSGHILVEAYDLLKAIYQERGYRAKDIPHLILENNLFGLEIDDRAAQLAAFALLMKARADDRNVFQRDVHLNILSIQESKGLDAREITEALNQPILKDEPPPSGELFEEIADEKAPLFSKNTMGVKGEVSQADVAHLIELFEHGKTFGSLIRIPRGLAENLSAIITRAEETIAHGGMLDRLAVRSAWPLLQQARLLAARYDALAMNPPYMGGRSMNTRVKGLAERDFQATKADTYAMFIERAGELTKPHGVSALVTMHSWLFLSTYQSMRRVFLSGKTLLALAHLGARAFPEIGGEVVKTQIHASFNTHVTGYRPTFFRLLEGDSETKREALLARRHCFCTGSQDDFQAIPGQPFAYWVGDKVRTAFKTATSLSQLAHPTGGMTTGNNELFLRYWWEVSHANIGFGCDNRGNAKRSKRKWFPYNKGGTFRKWYGNNELVVNWLNDGTEVIAHGRAYPRSRDYYFRRSITWTATSSSPFAARHSDAGSIFDAKGSSCFANDEDHLVFLAFLSSRAVDYFLEILNPTLEVQVGDVGNLPVSPSFMDNDPMRRCFREAAAECIGLARQDWDAHETSWDFQQHPAVGRSASSTTVQEALDCWRKDAIAADERLASLQQRIDKAVGGEYGLNEELAKRPETDSFLYRPTPDEDVKRLISYAVGCMAGRYSLDQPGLIYAGTENVGFDPAKYRRFAADDDGIVPVTKMEWFADDAAKQLETFLVAVWPREALEENRAFIAKSLDPRNGESAKETIRRYLADDFFKHHLRSKPTARNGRTLPPMYRNRPIYWLFSSGPERGFQALVYLHRYNEGTLSRMRTEYVIPLLGKITARIDQLTDDIASATSSQHRKRLEKEKSTLTKQLAEVQAYDEKLRHYADQRITLDLDDGVKVNYGKFGSLLAEVKAITGRKPSD